MITITSAPRQIRNVNIPNDITGIPSIDWQYSVSGISDATSAMTKKPLHTISGLWMEKFLSTTSQLWCTNFNFSIQQSRLSGIEAVLRIQRAARIQDLVIQLTLNGELIGNNLASVINPVQSNMYTGEYQNSPLPPHPVGDYAVYGSTSDLWNSELTSADIAQSSFGIVLSFKSNQFYPHTDLAVLSQIQLRASYD